MENPKEENHIKEVNNELLQNQTRRKRRRIPRADYTTNVESRTEYGDSIRKSFKTNAKAYEKYRRNKKRSL